MGAVAGAADAVVVDEPGLDPVNRLGAGLDRCGAWDALAAAAHAAGLAPADLPVVVVPDLGAFAVGSPAAADPELVAALIDLLHTAGYANVVVAASADSSALWAANRNVHALAELLGYRFVTPQGRDYDVIDLAEELTPAPFQPGEVLAGAALSRTWLEAGFRIVFASNKTDEADGYALALSTVMKALPLVDEDYHYRLAAHPGDVVAELLRATPVHLAVIDGIVSCHGSGGSRAPRAMATDCIIAAQDIWLADTVGAVKMGLDPAVSPLAARSPRRGDGLRGARVEGSLARYAGWVSPHPLILDSTTRRNASPWWSRLVRPWLQVLDDAMFPLESPLDARMNSRLAPFFADVDDDELAFTALVFANWTLAGLQQALDQYRVLYDKDALRRVNAPLGFDPDDHRRDAYDAIIPELHALERLLDGAPPRAPGLRWRYLDEAVLFDYSRVVPIDFDEFVAVVDVARAISYMNDYIGGTVVPVEHDEAGRPVRQAERNLYLPQPNYLVLAGGAPIDVSKLEVVEYSDQQHRMYWKTIDSENDSAVYDDGIVTFTRSGSGTSITIFGRQLFTLPPLLQTIDLGLNPELEASLVDDAYSTFFDRTLANLEAVAEGRDIRVGRAWVKASAPEVTEPLPAAAVERLTEEAVDWIASVAEQVRVPEPDQAGGDPPMRVDADGFAHFRATPPTRPPAAGPATPLADVVEFWAGLVEAGLRDAGSLAGAVRS